MFFCFDKEDRKKKQNIWKSVDIKGSDFAATQDRRTETKKFYSGKIAQNHSVQKLL